MSKHTPAPWATNGDPYVSTGNGNQAIAFADVRGISRDEAKANARLIAAAPELLEALQRIEQRISYYASLAEHEQPNIEQWAYTDQSDDMKIVRAAINKATGE